MKSKGEIEMDYTFEVVRARRKKLQIRDEDGRVHNVREGETLTVSVEAFFDNDDDRH